MRVGPRFGTVITPPATPTVRRSVSIRHGLPAGSQLALENYIGDSRRGKSTLYQRGVAYIEKQKAAGQNTFTYKNLVAIVSKQLRR